MIESISAITLATHNMSRALRFYCVLGFEIVHGGEDSAFIDRFDAVPGIVAGMVSPGAKVG